MRRQIGGKRGAVLAQQEEVLDQGAYRFRDRKQTSFAAASQNPGPVVRALPGKTDSHPPSPAARSGAGRHRSGGSSRCRRPAQRQRRWRTAPWDRAAARKSPRMRRSRDRACAVITHAVMMDAALAIQSADDGGPRHPRHMHKDQVARPHGCRNAAAEQAHGARKAAAELVINVFLIPGAEHQAIDGFGIRKSRTRLPRGHGNGQQHVSGYSPHQGLTGSAVRFPARLSHGCHNLSPRWTLAKAR